MGGSGRRDREFRETNSSHYKLVLPHNSQFTSKMAVNAHQRNQCCSTAFTRVVLNERFYIPRSTAAIKAAINKCNLCKLARNAFNRIEPPTGNVKSFRIPNPLESDLNKAYRVAFYDFKGPISCNDDIRFKTFGKKKPKKHTDTEEKPDQKLKVYILSMTCALTRHTTLEVCEDRSYESTKLAIQRIFY